jgi:ATP-dependent helicase/nuclease subunit A
VRTNSEVRAVAAMLREEGFDVIEEGRRLPVEDNAVGVVLLHLLRWLADPADSFAKEVVAMSPLHAVLEKRFGEVWQARWEGLLEEARLQGFAGMAEGLIEPCWEELAAFSRHRAGDVIGALAEFDASGGATAREARDWIEGLQISQAPGAAAVQVMTIHKSKGLGFDVVLVPGLEDRQVPDRGKFGMARGGAGASAWVLQPPAKWVRDLMPDLQVAEEKWGDEQRYEAMCLLYVALTRAKRGLYVLLPEVPKSRKEPESFGSLSNWIREAACGEDGVFESGDARWFEKVTARTPKGTVEAPVLAEGVSMRKRVTPSGEKLTVSGKGGTGKKVGLEVHQMFEGISWLKAGEVPKLARTQAGAMVEDLLREDAGHALFEKPDGEVELLREQAFEVLLDGSWMSGVIDRMHVFRDGAGSVERVEIFDYKTDRVESGEELVERYRGQMAAYCRAMRQVFECGEVRANLVSTALKGVIVVD